MTVYERWWSTRISYSLSMGELRSVCIFLRQLPSTIFWLWGPWEPSANDLLVVRITQAIMRLSRFLCDPHSRRLSVFVVKSKGLLNFIHSWLKFSIENIFKDLDCVSICNTDVSIKYLLQIILHLLENSIVCILLYYLLKMKTIFTQDEYSDSFLHK